MPEIRVVSPRWQLGPEHPDYENSGPYPYVMLRSKRRTRDTNGKRGRDMARRFSPTPEGAAAVTTVADRRNGIPPTAASSGHIYRTVDLLTPAMLDEAGATMLIWMLPIGIVTRDGRGREEAV